ncbi:hypothetical protein AYO44_13455 [Planctomycetaceae bacterium SCGC AG-212-F19]|nr:hypothetical protein AYO44_13455 [Planctomycetaceae bacterium SCGC AG-212-F19]
MATSHSHDPGGDTSDYRRQVLGRFEDAWHNSGPAPRIGEFVKLFAVGQPTTDAARRAFLEELVLIDLECRWRGETIAKAAAGANFSLQRPRLEDYVAAYPELGLVPRLPVELIAEEYRVRQRWGDRPSHADYATRFVRQWPGLRAVLVEIDRDLAQEYGTRASLPQPPRAFPAGRSEGMEPASSITSVGALVERLHEYELLDARQLGELADRANAATEPRALAQQLIKRGWLTPYQVNQLFQGRGRELVVGPYVVQERLGEGGVGQVFKAWHRKMNRVVALKIIRKELLGDPEVVGRFHREVQVLGQLDHPNIVHPYDAGIAGAGRYLAMEYVEGTDLGKLVKQGGPMPVEQACAYIRQAALGLQHAHERGLVHRDIKPHNLIMSVRDGLIKVADLGLARLPRAVNTEFTAALAGANGTGTLTPANAMLMGTADYLAPEQALDFHKADVRADIYSLGCTLYYLLAGQPPFPTTTIAEKLLKHQQAEPPSLASVRKDVPAGLDEVLRKMLAKQPADRFQTPAEVANALGALGFSAQAASGPSGQRRAILRRWRSAAANLLHGRRRLVLVGSSALLIATVLFFLLRGSPSGLNRLPGKPGDVVAVLGKPGQRRGVVVALSPDSRYVACLGPASGEQDQLVCLWDAETQKERSVSLPRGQCSLTFAPDGKTLAYLSGGTVILWDIPSLQQRARFTDTGHSGIASLAIAPDSSLLAAGCGSGAVELWDVATGTVRATHPKVAPAGIEAIQVAPDGRTLALTTKDGLVTLCSVEGAPERRPTEWFRVIFAPTGRVAAVWNRTGPIKLWNPADSTVVATIDTDSPDGFYRSVAFSPDGKLLADARGHFIRLWDITKPKDPKMTNDLPVSGTSLVTFVPQRTILVSVSSLIDGHKYHVWDPRTGQLLLQLPRKFASLALTADGRHMAIWGPYSDTVEIIRLPLAEKPGGS